MRKGFFYGHYSPRPAGAGNHATWAKKNIRPKTDVLQYFMEAALGQLFNLHVIQLYRRRTSEYLHRYFQLLLLVVHFFDYTVKVVERSFDDLNGFTNDEWLAHAYA